MDAIEWAELRRAVEGVARESRIWDEDFGPTRLLMGKGLMYAEDCLRGVFEASGRAENRSSGSADESSTGCCCSGRRGPTESWKDTRGVWSIFTRRVETKVVCSGSVPYQTSWNMRPYQEHKDHHEQVSSLEHSQR